MEFVNTCIYKSGIVAITETGEAYYIEIKEPGLPIIQRISTGGIHDPQLAIIEIQRVLYF